jgi:hypothetical protein
MPCVHSILQQLLSFSLTIIHVITTTFKGYPLEAQRTESISYDYPDNYHTDLRGCDIGLFIEQQRHAYRYINFIHRECHLCDH